MSSQLLKPIVPSLSSKIKSTLSATTSTSPRATSAPLPGPGITIRLLSEATREQATTAHQGDEILVLDEINVPGLYTQISQALAAFLPVLVETLVCHGRRARAPASHFPSRRANDYLASRQPMSSVSTGISWSANLLQFMRLMARVAWCMTLTTKPPGMIEVE